MSDLMVSYDFLMKKSMYPDLITNPGNKYLFLTFSLKEGVVDIWESTLREFLGNWIKKIKSILMYTYAH